MELNKQTTCAIIGEDFETLKISFEMSNKNLFLPLNSAIDNGYTTFISGMSSGFEVWSADFVCMIRDLTGENIKLVCAVPCILDTKTPLSVGKG